MGACETGATGAGVAIDFVRARSPIEARALSAVGDVGLAVDAGEASPARASVGVDVVFARGSVFARGALALVDLQGAARPREPRQAAAVVRVHAICAGASVQTGIWRAVVDVRFTRGPGESAPASADKAAERICAGPTVLARVAYALVDIIVAQLALPSRLAFALIAQVVRSVSADGVIGAWVRRAGGEDLGACGASVGRLADARETCHSVHTGPFV